MNGAGRRSLSSLSSLRDPVYLPAMQPSIRNRPLLQHGSMMGQFAWLLGYRRTVCRMLWGCLSISPRHSFLNKEGDNFVDEPFNSRPISHHYPFLLILAIMLVVSLHITGAAHAWLDKPSFERDDSGSKSLLDMTKLINAPASCRPHLAPRFPSLCRHGMHHRLY